MDEAIAAEARLRSGVLLRDEIGRDLRRRRLGAGELKELGRRALVSATTPSTWEQRLHVVRAEVADPMCFTGAAAVRLYDVPHPPRAPQVVKVLVPKQRDPLEVPGVEIIRAGLPDLVGQRQIRGLPVASLEVALRHTAREVSAQKAITLLQDELRLRHTTPRRLLSAMGRGRHGSAALRAALLVAGDQAHSRQERRIHQRMVARGIGGYRRGFNLVTAAGLTYWLDFFWEHLLAALEVNGGAHLDPIQAAYDARRARRVLTEFGIVLLPITAAEVDADVEGAVDEVDAFLRSRAAKLGVPVPITEL